MDIAVIFIYFVKMLSLFSLLQLCGWHMVLLISFQEQIYEICVKDWVHGYELYEVSVRKERKDHTVIKFLGSNISAWNSMER